MDDTSLVKSDEITLDMAQGLAHWDLNHNGQINGLYTGKFTFRVMLTPMQEIETDRDYRDLLGKNAEFASTHVEKLAYALSQLRARVFQAPPFWYESASRFPGSQVKDQEVISLVSEASLVAEIKYREELAKKREAMLGRLKTQLESQVKEDKVIAELKDAK